MTIAGWVLMLGSIGSVLSLVAFCFSRVLHTPEKTVPAHE